eukprot:6188635-Pleurochrysis_carterae.AAC.1
MAKGESIDRPPPSADLQSNGERPKSVMMCGAARRTTAAWTAARTPRSAAVLARLTPRDEERIVASMELLRPPPATALAVAPASTPRCAPQGVPNHDPTLLWAARTSR